MRLQCLPPIAVVPAVVAAVVAALVVVAVVEVEVGKA